MSKRFGRNQRRRAREQIARLEASEKSLARSMDMNAALLADQGRRLREAEDYAQRVADIVGDDSIASGSIRTVDARFAGGDHYRVAIQNAPPAFAAHGCGIVDIPALRVQTLRLLRSSAVRSRVSDMLHMNVTLSDKTVAYGISNSAIVGAPRGYLIQLLRNKIADDMARLLVKELRGN